MHIVLLVLKILGFTILGVIAFAFLVLLLFLIFPFRYRAELKAGSSLDVSADCGWLLRFLYASAGFADKKFDFLIKIFWFIPLNLTKDGGGNTRKDGRKSADTGEKTAEDTSAGHSDISGAKKKHKSVKTDRALIDRIEDFIEELENRYIGLADKYAFLTEDRSVKAIDRILKAVIRILRHSLPRRLSGYLIFGFDDPAMTGKTSAWISALLPLHRNRIDITPVFTEKTLDADVRLKGHIRIGTIVWIAFSALLNFNVLYLIRNFKKHFKSTGG